MKQSRVTCILVGIAYSTFLGKRLCLERSVVLFQSSLLQDLRTFITCMFIQPCGSSWYRHLPGFVTLRILLIVSTPCIYDFVLHLASIIGCILNVINRLLFVIDADFVLSAVAASRLCVYVCNLDKISKNVTQQDT
jgi:hypothetical protein